MTDTLTPTATTPADESLGDGPPPARIVLATIGVGVPTDDAGHIAAAVAGEAARLGYDTIIVESDQVSATRSDINQREVTAGPCPICLRHIRKYPGGRFYAHLCEPAGTRQHWKIMLPYRELLLSENQRLNRFEVARRVKQLRRDAYLLAKSRKLPRMARVRVTLHWQPATRRPRDSDNPTPTLKALCDGLVDARVVVDDTHDRMEKDIQIHDPDPGRPARLWLIVDGLEVPTPTSTEEPDHA